MGGFFWCHQSKLSRSDILRKHGRTGYRLKSFYNALYMFLRHCVVLEETIKRWRNETYYVLRFFLILVLAFEYAAVLRNERCERLNIKIPIFFHNRASEWMLKNTPVFLTMELADKNTRPWEVKMKTVTHVQKKLD